MTSRQRVAAALRREEPDRVPYCELAVDRALARQLMGWGQAGSQAADLERDTLSSEEAKAVATRLHLDNVSYVLRAPVYVDKRAGRDGRLFYGEGRIRRRADLRLLQLPDPEDEALYAGARAFLAQKGDYSAWFITRLGIFSTMLSMGTEAFGLAIYDDLPLIETLLDRYFDWIEVVAERVCKLGFDVFASTDDMAFNTGPLFSPTFFHEVVMPRYRRVAPKITLPWIIHSDGNVMPLLRDLLSLGIAGLHPHEKGAMDIRAMKRDYGDRLCLLGNVDLNLLCLGTPQEVEQEVRELIRDVAPGGGYILTSGNSLAGYLRPENVLVMAEAVQRYGQYPIQLL